MINTISLFDSINIFFTLLIIYVFYFSKKINLKESFIFFLLVLISVLIYLFISLDSTFSDQKIYLNCVQEIRMAFFEMRSYDCLHEQAQESFSSKAIERFSLIYALIPVPFYYSALSGILVNKILIMFFYIFLLKKIFLRPSLLLFIPSLILFSSLFLKETLVILFLVSGMVGAFHNKKILSVISLVLLIFIKIQAAIFLLIFFMIMLFQIIYLKSRKIALVFIFFSGLILLSYENRLISTLNNYIYVFTVNAINIGGINEQNMIINNVQSLKSRLKQSDLNPLISECIKLDLSRNQCKTYLSISEPSDLSSLTIKEIKKKRSSINQYMELRNPELIYAEGFIKEYQSYIEIIKNLPILFFRGALSPGYTDMKIQIFALIEKVFLFSLICFYLFYISKILMMPTIIFLISSNALLGAIIMNQGTLWRYSVPIIISTGLITQLKKK